MNNKTIKLKIIKYIKPGFIIFNILLILASISSAATSQTSYSETGLEVPGTIQAENFDLGGEGIAYHDTEAANQGNQYRLADGVDIEPSSDTGGGYNTGWTLPGEWLAYTVNVANTGNYNLDVRVANAGPGGTFHIEFNGIDKTGPITVPDTGGFQKWITLKEIVSLSAGQQVMKIVMDKKVDYNIGNINYIRITPLEPSYGGTLLEIPGTIQAENFDLGGEGISYHDTEAANQGNQYRLADGVDIEPSSDTGGGYNTGWTFPGEWLAYTVNVANTGNYNLDVRVANAGPGGTFHIEFNGADKTGPITVPDTGGFQKWTTLTKTVSLSEGRQVMKIVMDKRVEYNIGNINYIRITPATTQTPEPSATQTPEPSATQTPEPSATQTPEPSVTRTPEPSVTQTPAPIVSAAFYVATNGNDANPGTEDRPWRTIQKAADALTAGQTVYVKAGTYNEKIDMRNSGTADKYITFSSYPGDTVTIDGAGVSVGSWDGLVRIDGRSYIKFSGFRVINSKFMGILVTGNDHTIIEKNYITNTASSAIMAGDAKDITIDGNEITKAQTMSGLSSQTHETLSLVNVDGFEIKNNKLYNNNMESMDAKGGSRNGKIHHNDISGHISAGIYLDAWTTPAYNIEIFNNRVHDSSNSGARGIAVGVEQAGGSLRNVKIYNNIVYNNAASGFDVTWYSRGPVDNIQLINNVFYNNGLVNNWGGGVIVDFAGATNVVLRNNIVYNNRNYQIKNNAGSGTTMDSNIVDTNPLFVNPALGDFHLNTGSMGIDRGSSNNAPTVDFDGKSRPSGVSHDIGAYER